MPIGSIRDGIVSAEHAFALLEQIDGHYERRVTRWQTGAWLGIVAAMALPGALGQTALCLGILAGMRWLRLLVGGAGRYWLMHQLALRDFLAPAQGVDWGFLSSLLGQVPVGPVHSGPTEASAGGSPRTH